MKKKFLKPLALVLCAAVCAGSIGATVYARGAMQKQAEPEREPAVMLTANEESAAPEKDETVYVLAGADGSVQKIIVSDWIKNTLASATLTDSSELTDVENVKGDETYTMDSSNARVWDAAGNDIYYQGNIEKELPVTLKVSYTLDGKSVTPEDLAGKSGHVVIRYDYENKQYETVTIDGKQEKIYVPFAMLTGMLLDTDTFRNVEVSNGKLLNDGSRYVVAGIALPGMQESLGLDAQTLEIPSYVEVSADVENFSMMNTVTIATNEIFNQVNPDKLDSADGLEDSLNDLTDGMRQLLDGSSQLYDGLCTLLEKSEELVSGIDKLAAGAQKLSAGLAELDSHSSELNAGSTQVFTTLLATADSELAKAGLTVPQLTIENYAAVLNGVLAQLDETNVYQTAYNTALEKVTAAVDAKMDEITAGVTAAVQAGVKEQVLAGYRAKVVEGCREQALAQVLQAMGISKEDYEGSAEVKAQVDAKVSELVAQAESNGTIDALVKKAESDGTIDALVAQQMQTAEVKALLEQKIAETRQAKIDEAMNSPEVQDQITAALEKAKSGAASISALKGQLDSYNTFYTGLKDYTAGVSTAAAGANELYQGILTMKNGAPALVDGVTKLRDGAMQLSDGLKEFDEKGVSKLTELVEGDLEGMLERVKAIADVSRNYRSFAGISDDMDGQVKFIYRTDAIGD